MKLTFEITFASDYHIGAGYGLPPEVDSALHRDPDGVPVIRGTELAGLLRQGLFDLLQLPLLQDYRHCQASGLKNGLKYCGEKEQVDEMCPICAILGTPARPKPWLIASARPLNALKPLKPDAHWQSGETAAQITTRARINPRTRRAEHNKLFTREEGDGRLRFRFEASTVRDDDMALDQAAWLTAAARMVRRLGSGRRRGLGECEFHVIGEGDWSEAKLLERFGKIVQDGVQRQATEAGTLPVPDISTGDDAEEAPYRVQVVMRLDEPLLVARRAEAGNRFESVDMLPGTLLRGALAWRIAHRFGDDLKDEAYDAFLQLFFHDNIRFSFLYPVTPANNLRRGYLNLPASLDLRTCEVEPGYKEAKGHGVWSKLYADDSQPEYCRQCDQQGGNYQSRLEALQGFIKLNKARPTSNQSPTRSVEMHIRMEPKTGRVQGGDLFSYVALEPGQYFVGEIRCANKSLWQALLNMADMTETETSRLRLGKATRRGHGLVSLVWQMRAPTPWLPTSTQERITNPAEVVMTLLSPAIVTDAWGRGVSGFDRNWIARELGMKLDQVEIDDEKAFARQQWITSFNAQWGLPRTQDVALAAGSTVLLSFNGVDLDTLQGKLAEVEARGLGLRREEGFGMVAFNHPLHQQPDAWPQFKRIDLKPLSLAANQSEAKALVAFIQVWESYLDEHFAPGAFRDDAFDAVARILQSTPGRHGSALKQRLQALGRQEQVIPAALAGREHTPFAQSDEGKQGMDKLFEMLEYLKDEIEEQTSKGGDAIQFWKIGLEMLSDRIARAHKKAN